MKAKELRSKSEKELLAELLELNREAFNLRMQKSTGQMARFSDFKKVRRNIARVKTILNERSEGQ